MVRGDVLWRGSFLSLEGTAGYRSGGTVIPRMDVVGLYSVSWGVKPLDIEVG